MDSLTKLGLQTAITIGVAVADAYRDYRVIKKGDSINHGREAIARLAVLVIVSLFDIGILFYLCGVFWIVFEIVLNRLRGLHWLYVSSWKGENYSLWDAVVRQVFKKNTEVKFFLFKLGVLIVSLLNLFVWHGLTGFR